MLRRSLLSGIVAFILVSLLVSGHANAPMNYHRRVFFGAIFLTSNFSLGLHTCLIGTISCVAGYGLIKGYRFGWWCTLCFLINSIFDSLLTIYDSRLPAIIGIFISLGIITWLFYRRRLYNVDRKSEK